MRAETQHSHPASRNSMIVFPQWRAQLEHQFELIDLLDNAPNDQADGATKGFRPAAAPRYRILRLLARGGIGQVMQAIDTELNREVAVKEIQSQLLNNASVRERFLAKLRSRDSWSIPVSFRLWFGKRRSTASVLCHAFGAWTEPIGRHCPVSWRERSSCLSFVAIPESSATLLECMRNDQLRAIVAV